MGLLEDIANVVFGSKPLNELPEKAEVDIGDLVAVWSSANNRLEKHDARLLQSDWSEVNSEKLAHIKNKPENLSDFNNDLPLPVYTIDIVANRLKLYKDGVEVGDEDLSLYLDDTNLARLTSGTLNATTGIATFTRDDATTFTIDLSGLIDTSDGQNYHIIRKNTTEGAAPTSTEVANPKDGDTAIVMLRNFDSLSPIFMVELWQYSASSWVRSGVMIGESIIRRKRDSNGTYRNLTEFTPIDGLFDASYSLAGHRPVLTLPENAVAESVWLRVGFYMNRQGGETYHEFDIQTSIPSSTNDWASNSNCVVKSDKNWEIIFGEYNNRKAIFFKSDWNLYYGTGWLVVKKVSIANGQYPASYYTWKSGWGGSAIIESDLTSTTETQIALPNKGLIEVKDHLNSVKFSGSEIGFSDDFDFDTVNKEVTLKPLGLVQIKDADGDTRVEVEANADEDKIRFTTASSERMLIDESGNVGIGTTGPVAKLDINDSSNDVNLTSTANFAINTGGLIASRHHKNVNLETPELEWSVGGSTDLNWKKLATIVINDNNYSGFGSEVEITDFSGDYGSLLAEYGDVYRGGLSIYHQGATGVAPKEGIITIHSDMSPYIRIYKIAGSGNSSYEIQVKSPADYRQMYVKLKAGIGNNIASITPHANDTNGSITGGTVYTPDAYTSASQFKTGFTYLTANRVSVLDSVGIGTTNPTAKLTVVDDILLTGSSPSLTLTDVTSSFVVATNTAGEGIIKTSADKNIRFLRNGSSETMRIAATTGNVGIGTTSPAYKLDVSGTIRATGDVIAFSDIRVKENIKTIDNALDKVKKLRGVEYNKIDSSEKSIGVIAQEIQEVIPEVVREDDQGMKSVAYGNITAVLIEAIKEQQKQIDELKSIINAFTK